MYFLNAPQVIQVCESILSWRWVLTSRHLPEYASGKGPFERERRHVWLVCWGVSAQWGEDCGWVAEQEEVGKGIADIYWLLCCSVLFTTL